MNVLICAHTHTHTQYILIDKKEHLLIYTNNICRDQRSSWTNNFNGIFRHKS